MLAGKQIVMFFEKPSLRTRVTFEAGMASLGGLAIFVDQTTGRLDAREKLSDIAHNLERWVDGIVLRTFSHATVEGMAEHASIPVINALSDLEHPCQALADYFTLQERFGDLKKIAWLTSATETTWRILCLLACASIGSKHSDGHACGLSVRMRKIVADARRRWRDKTGAGDRIAHRSRRRRSAGPMPSIPMPGPAWATSTRKPERARFSRPTRSTTNWWRRRRHMRSSCIACRRIAARRSPTRVIDSRSLGRLRPGGEPSARAESHSDVIARRRKNRRPVRSANV